jgi:DUF4097 and DUF4098 domain-containing protein YvlB
MQKLRLQALLLVLACLLAFSACDISEIVDASGDATVVESFSFAVDMVNQSRLRLEGVNGPIDVVGVAGASQVEIWGERRVTSKSETDARDYMRNLEVRVTDSNDEVFVKTVQPRETHGRNLEVIYHLRIPGGWETLVGNVNGNVLIDSLNGSVTVGLVNGNVTLREIAGTTSVGLTNGNVGLTKIVGNTSVSLVNGNIGAEVALPQKGTCEMSAVNGTIGLRIPQSTSAQFSAEVANGAIAITHLIVQDATTTPNSVRGRLADGDGKITLKTVNGNIRVEGV